MTTKKLLSYLISTVLIVFTIVFLLGVTTENSKVKEEIRVEVVKSLLQFSIVVVIGTGISALSKSVEAQHKKTELRTSIRSDYLNRLGTIYRNAKRVRRALRAARLTVRYGDPIDIVTGLSADTYREQVQQLNEVQLQLEGLKIEAESLPAFAMLEGLTECLRKMEDYLRQIWNEYEEANIFLEKEGSVSFSQLERLNEFTERKINNFQFTHYSLNLDYRFKSHFSDPFYSAITIISQGLA